MLPGRLTDRMQNERAHILLGVFRRRPEGPRYCRVVLMLQELFHRVALGEAPKNQFQKTK